MEFTRRNIQKNYKRNNDVAFISSLNNESSNSSTTNIPSLSNKLDKSVWDEHFYLDENGNLHSKKNFVSDLGLTSYGKGYREVSTIMDGVVTDETTITKQNGILTVIGGTGGGGGASNWDELEGKPSWITDTKPTYSWNEITSKPSTFTPSTHTHTISNITNLQATLDNKANSSHTHSQYVNKSGDTMTGALSTPQINGGGSTLLIGNSGNSSYVKFQEDVKQLNDNWSITNNGAASFDSVSASGIVRGDGGFITNSTTILQFDKYTYKDVLKYGWTSAEGDFIDLKIPGTSEQTKYAKLSYNKGLETYCPLRVINNSIRIVDTSWNTNRYVMFSEGDTETYCGYLKYTGADNLILGTRNNSTTDIDALRVKRGYKDVTVYGNLLVEGGITCYTSDERLKDKIEDISLSLEDIANSPTIKFKWNDKRNNNIHVGGIAQYTQKILPETVIEEEGILNMDYSVTAYIYAVQTAKHLQDINNKLQKKVEELEKKITDLNIK